MLGGSSRFPNSRGAVGAFCGLEFPIGLLARTRHGERQPFWFSGGLIESEQEALLASNVVSDWLTGRAARRQFDQFADEVTDALLRTGFLMTFDVAETEDLVQETLVRVARRWDRVRVMDRPAVYARRILVNLVIDTGQGRSRRHAELRACPGDDLEGRPDVDSVRPFRSVDAISELQWALGTLARRQRAVIVLRYWEDLSEAEVSELLGCSVGTVKSAASRGLARLREVMTATDTGRSGVIRQQPERKHSSC